MALNTLWIPDVRPADLRNDELEQQRTMRNRNANTGGSVTKFISVAAGAVLTAAALIIPPAVQAQEYPTRPIRMIVPFGPGTGSDVLGRVLAQKLSEQIGQ